MSHNLWLLLSALLVFVMQAGFLCLESGRTRSKNSINVAAKNVSDFVVSCAIFWLFGFAFLFGASESGIIGTSLFTFGENRSAYEVTFFIFQMMFCSTAATLTSGAVAERTTFIGYLLTTIILSGFIYPVTGHWAWAGALDADNLGWLQRLGFVDFAGSTVVHSVGGWVALAAVIVIGPRLGRFDGDRPMPQGSNLPMAALGTLLIWFGWFGFNGGSTLALTDKVPIILLNTCLSALWGGIVATALMYWSKRYFDVCSVLNGIIAGLVAITAACHAVTPFSAALIGVVAGAVVHYGEIFLARLKVDDALAVVPAHLFAGIWGTLAVALFGKLELLATGLSRLDQLLVQLGGIVAIGCYSFALSYCLLRVLNRFIPLRVTVDDEIRGLNIAEHRASTELIDLLASMELQQNRGDYTSPVFEEPFTEVGQIARKYNQVIAQVAEEMKQKDSAINQFQASEKRKSAILDSSMDSIVTIDRHGRIIEFNPAAERTFGCLKRQVKDGDFIDLFALPGEREVIRSNLKHVFSESHGLLLNRRNSMTLQRVSSQPFPAEVTITTARPDSGGNSEFTLHIRDVTRRLKLEKRLKFLAYSDPLTSLANRTFLLEELRRTLRNASMKNTTIAILFMDMDKFKKINDTLGHKAGDELLCEVAARLTELSRGSDIVARWGGDEFILMMAGDITESLVCERAGVILESMRKPLNIAGKTFSLPTSIGVVVSSDSDIEAEKLIQRADIAMYWAKQKGRDNYQLFTPEMAHHASRTFRFEQEMKQALAKDEFSLRYQPKVHLDKADVIGIEALIRWHHPVDGQISPGEFIPVAEESNLIIHINEWVIERTIRQLCDWREGGFPLVPIAVNISGRHLVSDELVPYISKLLTENDIEGSLLHVEITESILLHDMDRCIEVMEQLKALDISISIDDFGTGYSSLNYLKRLPIDTLKIDQSFVRDCDVKEEDRQICATIINLARNLNLDIVAEGVETDLQRQTLVELGCENFQGYLFHRPMSVQELELWWRGPDAIKRPASLAELGPLQQSRS